MKKIKKVKRKYKYIDLPGCFIDVFLHENHNIAYDEMRRQYKLDPLKCSASTDGTFTYLESDDHASSLVITIESLNVNVVVHELYHALEKLKEIYSLEGGEWGAYFMGNYTEWILEDKGWEEIKLSKKSGKSR
jgi:hypothetical protein